MAAMQQARLAGGAAAPRLMAVMTAAFAAGQLAGPLTVGPLAGATAAEGVPLAASLVAAAVLLLGAAMLLPRGRTS